MIISCNSTINVSGEMDITIFYNGLVSLARHIFKHNELIISRDVYVQIIQDENNKFGLLNQTNRSSKFLTDFSRENSLLFQNTKFQETERKKLDKHLPK